MRQSLPVPFTEDLEARQRLSETVVDTLAALHAVDIHTTDIVSIGKPEGLVRRQVQRLGRALAALEDRRAGGNGRGHQLARAATAARVGSAAATIVHNDFKLDNLMLTLMIPPV